MRKAAPFVALFFMLAAAAGSMWLWWLSAPLNETRYIWDYCRFTIGIPSSIFWPYRIETVQHLPIAALPDAVYGGRPLYQVLLWPLIATMTVGVLGLFVAAILGPGTQRRQGKVIRGPRIISNFQWWLLQVGRKKGFCVQPLLPIPEDRLSHHIHICGRTGTRKSSIVRELVDQAIARGMWCLFLDPKQEYWEEYGDPDRDALFNPLDERSIDWQIGEESIDEARGISVMDGAFPDVHGKSAFFQDYARAITAYLNGIYHPDCATLAAWFADRKEIIKRVKGTEYEETLSNPDGELATGIIATINQFGRSLRLMALAKGGRPFSVRKWGEAGRSRIGHIFLCSEPDTRKALMPVHTMVFDLALVSLEKHGGPVFVVGDEIPILQSRQLGTAMRLLRAAGCPILIGDQDFPTMAGTFGQREAESMVSNAYTQIVLGQSEPNTAEWSSKLLGLPTDIERKQEYQSAHWWQKHQHNTRTETVRESAVTGGEIQDLEDGCGFLKQAGRITPLKVKWRPSNPRIPKSIPRQIVTLPTVVPMPQKKASRYAAQAKP